ncbi:MAG: DUF2510 domain-containing protein [Actinomycetota bacterium]
MNTSTGLSAGWFPDPTGRFEVRYHNGRSWTADVADDGHRMVDPDGVSASVVTPAGSDQSGSTQPPGPDAPTPNRVATAGMIVAIVAASLTWMPFIVVVGVVLALVALGLSTAGLSRSRKTGGGRGAAIAGLSIALGALLLAVLGVVLSVLVYTEIDAFRTPGPHEATITECALNGSTVTASGTITNLGSEQQSYSIEVAIVRAGTNNVQRSPRVDVNDVAPGSSASFELEGSVGVDAVNCRIESVDGPLPFGVEI